jgi:hypothetical protein
MLPETAEYFSPDTGFRFTVTPADVDSQLAYFEDKVSGRDPPGIGAAGAQVKPRGILEQRQSDGRWRERWRRDLLNEVAPAEALVANGGNHAVTFDNWHSLGYGDTVVVIYGAGGELVRSLALRDIVPESRIEKLPRSVSSIRWRKGESFSEDGARLILRVPVATGSDDRDAGFEQVEIDLATGKVVERASGESKLALALGGAALLFGWGVFAIHRRGRSKQGLPPNPQ